METEEMWDVLDNWCNCNCLDRTEVKTENQGDHERLQAIVCKPFGQTIRAIGTINLDFIISTQNLFSTLLM